MTGATEQHIRIVNRIYEMREAAKTLLGDRYQARMAELGAVLTELATKQKIDVLKAAMLITKQPETPAMIVIQIYAATAELIEPSPPSERK